jgi:hypothetical protein
MRMRSRPIFRGSRPCLLRRVPTSIGFDARRRQAVGPDSGRYINPSRRLGIAQAARGKKGKYNPFASVI